MKLSKNFSLEELTRSATATKLGIDNTSKPDDEHLKNLQVVVDEIAQAPETIFGKRVRINSGYRSLH